MLNPIRLLLLLLALSFAPELNSCNGYWSFSGLAHAASRQDDFVDPARLAASIAERAARVSEFVELRRMAQERGLRVWLFGGTAAAFAHYVKWDLLRERGDTRFESSRFDYGFTNIYRSTQDADLVVDGTPEQVRELEQALQRRFPYFIGSKEQWELRPLRHDLGEKLALLNNPDFLNQHTDSNSTGMIELTMPSGKEPVVRDLRDWTARKPQFLIDVAEGKLHYYFSDSHETTSRFKAGKNPPILSVVRFLTKAFQFELEIRSEDAITIRRIIDSFEPEIVKDHYAKAWLEKNGPKLFTHAVDVEYAWNVLEELGLRRKLIALSEPNRIRSLGWWLNKEPLRSRPVGQAAGKTIAEIAREKGIPLEEFVVAHETSDFLAYESLTRNTKNAPNVFISRSNGVGEVAAYGDGHYTRIGRAGARGTGLTVRYRPAANAREGVDFTMAHDYLIWTNRQAIQVISEGLNIGPVQYFELLAEGELFLEGDKGIREKLRRKIENRLRLPDSSELRQILTIIYSKMEKRPALLAEWLELPVAVQHRDMLERVVAARNFELARVLISRALAHPGWERHHDLLERLLDQPELRVIGTNVAHVIATKLLPQPHAARLRGIAERIIRDPNLEMVVKTRFLKEAHWAAYPELGRLLIESNRTDDPRLEVIARDFLLERPWQKHGELRELFLEKATPRAIQELVSILQRRIWQGPLEQVDFELTDRLVEKGHLRSLISFGILNSAPYLRRLENWERQLHDFANELRNELHQGKLDRELLRNWLFLPVAHGYPDLIEAYLGHRLHILEFFRDFRESSEQLPGDRYTRLAFVMDAFWALIDTRLTRGEEKALIGMLERIIWTTRTRSAYGQTIAGEPVWFPFQLWFRLPQSANHPEVLEKLVDYYNSENALKMEPQQVLQFERRLVHDILEQPHIRMHPRWVKAVFRLRAKSFSTNLVHFILESPESAQWPEIPLWIARKMAGKYPPGSFGASKLDMELARPHWNRHPALLRLTGGAPVSYESLLAAIGKGATLPMFNCERLLTQTSTATSFIGDN